MSGYRLSEHAAERASERGIPLSAIDQVTRNPEEIINCDEAAKYKLLGRVVIDGRECGLCVVIGTDTDPSVIVTVYKVRLKRESSTYL